MSRPVVRLVLIALLVASAGSVTGRQAAPVIVHEWGTFTTVAGEQGQAVEWLPLGGPQDLPCFVYPFDSNRFVKVWPARDQPPPLTYDTARFAMRGTVRMETPVVYFYSRERASVDVTVEFPQGLMTEWYPFASVYQPAATVGVLRGETGSVMQWRDVAIRPEATPAFPTERAPSHYYPARETDAAPIRVGTEDEKFLFYRGVAGFQPPMLATVTPDGVRLSARGRSPIEGVVLFERRDSRVGYRVLGTLRGEATVPRPALTSDVASLHRDLEAMLIASGLYAKEARAMIETWRDSWFEEGTRLFYLVPPAFVDAILPLHVSPAPAATVRTFVGRVEVFTEDALQALRHAIAEGDDALVVAYGRFLDPMTERLLSRARPEDRARITDRVNATYREYLDSNAVRCQ